MDVKVPCVNKEMAYRVQELAEHRHVDARVLVEGIEYSVCLYGVDDSDILYVKKGYDGLLAASNISGAVGSTEKLVTLFADVMFNDLLIPVTKDLLKGTFNGYRKFRRGLKDLENFESGGDYSHVKSKFNQINDIIKGRD